MTTKQATRIKRAGRGHWVGDGFPVSTMFSYAQDSAEISPFLLLDYAGPAVFEPSDTPRGVEVHPHRGFETVTIVYQGEVAHKDNAGHAGVIGPGDVQWMTAARGILHEEKHSDAFTQQGGTLEMVQFWVNLRAQDKMTDPAYQDIRDGDIPVVTLPNAAGHMRLIAGEYAGMHGAARTFTPVDLWDMRLTAHGSVDLAVPNGHNTMILVLAGAVKVNGGDILTARELCHFTPEGDTIVLETQEDTIALLMGGAPIDEPVVGRGPFVMNTAMEIADAMSDYALGKF